MGFGSFGDSRSYGGSSLGGSAQSRSSHERKDHGGSRRSDYSFSKVNEWQSSKTSSDGGKSWSLKDNSNKSNAIRSTVAQKAASQISTGAQSVDPYTATLQQARTTGGRVTMNDVPASPMGGFPVSADANSDLSMMYTAEAKEEMTRDALNVPGPIGSVAGGLGGLEREPEILSERGKYAKGALRDTASELVNKRDNLTGSTIGDNVLGVAASLVGGPIGGVIARGAIAAGSAANITDSPFYDGEQVKHQGVGDYGEGSSAKKKVNPTQGIIQDSLEGGGGSSSGGSVNVVPPKRDNSIGIGRGGLSGRVADFAGSLAIKPKRNSNRGRV